MNSVDEGLRALMRRGFRFQHLKDVHGRVCVVVGSFGWPECYDRIQINDENDAIATRAVVDTAPSSDDVVWSYEGDALAAINALLEVPKPHERGAPRLTRRAPSGLWLPGAGFGAASPPPGQCRTHDQ